MELACLIKNSSHSPETKSTAHQNVYIIHEIPNRQDSVDKCGLLSNPELSKFKVLCDN